jgi:flagellar hook-length control protein FliK
MEFNALPSQGAGSSHNPSDSKKETAEGFDEALEKALAESGMAIGIPTFVQNEAELPLTELDIPRSETNLREPDSVEEPLRRESQTQGESDDLDWKALEAKSQGDSSSTGKDNESAGQGSGDKSAAGSMNHGTAPTGNQHQQPTLGKSSHEAGASIQEIKGAKSGASKANASVKVSGQIADRIIQIVSRMNEQGQKVHKAVMRLRPEKLGLLEIELKLEDGRLSVRLSATQSEAREMLQGELEKIRAVLSEQGFDAIDMQLENGKHEDRGEQNSQGTSTSWEPESLDLENESIRNWDGLVDLLA